MREPTDSALTLRALAELRHELRTPLNQIIGYCEMLLEDATGPAHAARREALEAALAAGREALATIHRALPAARTDVGEPEVAALLESLRAPKERILRATHPLLAEPEEEFVADVLRIRGAAERLTAPAPAPPRSAPARSAGAGDAAADAGGEPAAAGPAPARILVVDDHEDNRSVLQRRLQRQGCAVECAASGGAALEILAARSFDLVLLDVMMPGLDGYAVLERLKGSPSTRDIPVIMVSALDELASIVRCIERGAEDYLPKPFEPALLKARIGACLEKKRLRDREVAYLREVERVIDAARDVEAGNYRAGALADVAARADELGRLARVVEAMVAGVKVREERLKRQVDDLRREILRARAPAGAEAGAAADGRAGALSPGQVFAGRYEILQMVGSGGMGVVYRTRDRELGEDVAIKMLHGDLTRGGGTAIERLKAETRLARRISHRNVVRTHDFGEWEGAHYVTMEFVEGMTVRQLIDMRGRLGVSPTLAIATQLAGSLEVAHQQGVIHRDIKPQNLLLDAEGVLKVMDFGIARLAERTSALTQTGVVVGTPAYMSPEQLLAEEVDGRSDLYSTGVVLYECLTGRLPFEAKSPISLVAKLLHDEPTPPATLNADVPPALSALVLRLLAKRAEDRPGSAGELVELLAQLG